MTVATELARRIVGLRYEQIPAQAIQRAKIALLDTLGVALAGSREPCVASAERALGRGGASGPGPGAATGPTGGASTVLGRGWRAPPLEAAFVNGIAAHALDFDDVNESLLGHPSAPPLAALFAVGEQAGSSGRDLLAAYVVGFETGAKIGRAVNVEHYVKGWHPTSTLGVFGVAAACAKLLGLAEAETATALAIAASSASGIKANFGTMTKPLHVGLCARGGLLAALLAREGFTANPAAFEQEQGFFNVYNGKGTYAEGRIFERWANPLDLLEPGVAQKRHPCCGSTHSSVDAVLQLREQQGLRPEQVGRLEALISDKRILHVNRPDPKGGLDAKFSIQYCLARALLRGEIVLEDFEGEGYRDPETRRLMERIQVLPDPRFLGTAENPHSAVVSVTTGDGQVHRLQLDHAHGYDGQHPLPDAAVHAKFRDCAGRALPPGAVERLLDGMSDLERVADVRPLVATAGG
ncbi:MAG: MmgE/PrpD family protein [Candidatus Lambdaproteobacteria bacterium]|nr:MmgE/PrpD family protein [Candidatus Lambdaproteobacteria bacterium]